ncbi:hypothetical protein AXG93_2643s1000 [Marchantia polymorpha subsp. ruderalis]|uniref:Uncharacterized protein n=1 Tax=Marchantia polymorpha subsp. ruderalis TaxID=1480154 RepID=A0A176W0Y6_MARPO|nr:hypothetical protein AXG93_2643s1000 [Marchantia polymorpha subsp. ruderalis]
MDLLSAAQAAARIVGGMSQFLESDQRNYSIAIEVSELEASITQLKMQASEKSLELERTQKQASEAEYVLQEQLGRTNQEVEDLKRRVNEIENQLSVNVYLNLYSMQIKPETAFWMFRS